MSVKSPLSLKNKQRNKFELRMASEPLDDIFWRFQQVNRNLATEQESLIRIGKDLAFEIARQKDTSRVDPKPEEQDLPDYGKYRWDTAFHIMEASAVADSYNVRYPYDIYKLTSDPEMLTLTLRVCKRVINKECKPFKEIASDGGIMGPLIARELGVPYKPYSQASEDSLIVYDYEPVDYDEKLNNFFLYGTNDVSLVQIDYTVENYDSSSESDEQPELIEPEEVEPGPMPEPEPESEEFEEEEPFYTEKEKQDIETLRGFVGPQVFAGLKTAMDIGKEIEKESKNLQNIDPTNINQEK